MPRGCPRAIAPPLELTRGSSSSIPSSLLTVSTWAAKASLISITPISSNRILLRLSNFLTEGTGPYPIMRGSTPAVEEARIRARGFRLCSSAAFSEAMIKAAAPSFTPDAFPAVTEPPERKGAGSLDSFSRVVSPRGCSSCSTCKGSCFLRGTDTGIISMASLPAAMALEVFCCELKAKES